MNPIDKLKLSKSTKLFLWIGSPIGAILLALIIELIKDSIAFQQLKNIKLIDSIINMITSANLPLLPILIALAILSLTFNVFLFKRMNLYLKAAEKFGELFYTVSYKLSKLTGKPVTVNFSKRDFIINAGIDHHDERKNYNEANAATAKSRTAD